MRTLCAMLQKAEITCTRICCRACRMTQSVAEGKHHYPAPATIAEGRAPNTGAVDRSLGEAGYSSEMVEDQFQDRHLAADFITNCLKTNSFHMSRTLLHLIKSPHIIVYFDCCGHQHVPGTLDRCPASNDQFMFSVSASASAPSGFACAGRGFGMAINSDSATDH